jgi:hypothetical protein
MIKFLTCFVGWCLFPVVVGVVAFEVMKTWLEFKLMGK